MKQRVRHFTIGSLETLALAALPVAIILGIYFLVISLPQAPPMAPMALLISMIQLFYAVMLFMCLVRGVAVLDRKCSLSSDEESIEEYPVVLQYFETQITGCNKELIEFKRNIKILSESLSVHSDVILKLWGNPTETLNDLSNTIDTIDKNILLLKDKATTLLGNLSSKVDELQPNGDKSTQIIFLKELIKFRELYKSETKKLKENWEKLVLSKNLFFTHSGGSMQMNIPTTRFCHLLNDLYAISLKLIKYLKNESEEIAL